MLSPPAAPIRATLTAGDGIGHESTDAIVAVRDALGAPSPRNPPRPEGPVYGMPAIHCALNQNAARGGDPGGRTTTRHLTDANATRVRSVA